VFENMVQRIILPTVQRKDFPDVMRLSYNAMGLLAITHFNLYRNFLKLFFDQVEKQSPEFREFDMTSLCIIFDSILQNKIDTSCFPKELM
jgi:hypothetical protein